MAALGAAIAGSALLTAGVVATAGAATTHPAAQQRAALSYVAVGDSYTSGAGILPLAPGAPVECLQTVRNYPHRVAAALGLALTDRSCSGATTANLTTTAQYQDQPPQFDALQSSTRVVTVGIGGNDNNVFISSIEDCFSADALDFANVGAPCKARYGDTFANEVRSDGPTIAAALAEVHRLSPRARVFVVGYLDILPQQGNCYPQVLLTTGDTAYLNQLEKTLNGMLADEAAANRATFVNEYTPSIGHDACQPSSVRWVEPPVPTTDAAPVHPDANGERADAVQVEAAMRAAHL